MWIISAAISLGRPYAFLGQQLVRVRSSRPPMQTGFAPTAAQSLGSWFQPVKEGVCWASTLAPHRRYIDLLYAAVCRRDFFSGGMVKSNDSSGLKIRTCAIASTKPLTRYSTVIKF